MKMRWRGTSITSIADEAQGVTDLNPVSIRDSLTIQVSVIQAGISDRITYPNNLTTTVRDSNSVSLSCSGSYNRGATPSENVDTVVIPSAPIPGGTEGTLDGAHTVSVYWKCQLGFES